MNIFLPTSLNICFVCTHDLSHFEYSQDIFWLEIKIFFITDIHFKAWTIFFKTIFAKYALRHIYCNNNDFL